MNHYIISNYLKASKTFDVYRDLFHELSIPDSYKPVEIRTKEASTVSNLEVNELKNFLNKFRGDENDTSIVVSNPFKQVIVRFCDTLSSEAKMMQTVNLIYKKEGKLFGRNIDGKAFFLGQKKLIDYDFTNKRIYILGSGGVSTAVSFTLAKSGVSKLMLFDIDTSKSKHLAKILKINYPKVVILIADSVSDFSEYDVIYNGTGVGKKSHSPDSVYESPITRKMFIPANILAIDANYTPLKTEFLRVCEDNGCQILNGFSHMIGFTTLHLSEVLNKQIDFDTVRVIGERYVNL